MRICPVCPVMEIIVPVDVTDVEQEAAQALWDLQDQPVPEAVREFRVLWVLRDHRGNREYRDIREQRVRQEPRVQRESSVRREQQEPLLRQYMHNTEIAVTMRLSTILKTIKQPL